MLALWHAFLSGVLEFAAKIVSVRALRSLIGGGWLLNGIAQIEPHAMATVIIIENHF